MNGDLKMRIILCYVLLGACVAGGIALGIAGVFLPASPTKKEVKTEIAAAVGGRSDLAAIGACEGGIQNAAAQESLIVITWKKTKYKGVAPGGKTLVDVTVELGDGYGNDQELSVECTLTKGVYQVSGIQKHK